jgi:glycogen(starch) synthase
MGRGAARELRVLHITPEFPPVIWGGLGTAVGGLVNASGEAGMAVGVLLVGGVLVLERPIYGHPRGISQEQLAEAWSKTRAGRGGVTFFQVSPDDAVDAGVRLARAWRPDVIHLHTAWLWSVAQAIRERTGAPLVFTVHSLDRVEYEIGRLASCWEMQDVVIREADRVIAISRSERELLEQYLPEACPRARIVGNGIDDCAAARAAVGGRRPGESPLVLYTGRFVDRKGIRELLSAIPLVLEQAPATRFVLVGGYGGGAEIERSWLADTLRPYQDRVHFTGWLASDEVAAWYRDADILIVPSWYEPFGMVVLEGMLHGLAIAASGVGGPAEILEHGRTGLLFPPRDVNTLAGTLVRLVADAGLRRRIGVAAAEEVRRRWLWPRIVKRMRAVYQELLRKAGPPRGMSARPFR